MQKQWTWGGGLSSNARAMGETGALPDDKCLHLRRNGRPLRMAVGRAVGCWRGGGPTGGADTVAEEAGGGGLVGLAEGALVAVVGHLEGHLDEGVGAHPHLLDEPLPEGVVAPGGTATAAAGGGRRVRAGGGSETLTPLVHPRFEGRRLGG